MACILHVPHEHRCPGADVWLAYRGAFSEVQVPTMQHCHPLHSSHTTGSELREDMVQVGGAHFFAEEVPEAAEAEGAMPIHDEVPADAPAAAKEATVAISVTYTVTAGGQLSMEWEVDASHALPAQLAPNLFKCAAHPFAHMLLRHLC